MEIATQEYPLLIDDVRVFFTDDMKQVFIAEIRATKIGYILMDFDRREPIVRVASVGVLPKFRHHGVGSKLMEHACTQAYAGDVRDIRINVPSYQVDDLNDPWNIDHWLWKVGFKAIGVKHGECFRYGRDYDYYVFQRLPV
jgi:GNAT superfamily N-acetyltransferase